MDIKIDKYHNVITMSSITDYQIYFIKAMLDKDTAIRAWGSIMNEIELVDADLAVVNATGAKAIDPETTTTMACFFSDMR